MGQQYTNGQSISGANNNRLKANVADRVGIDREQIIKEFNEGHSNEIHKDKRNLGDTFDNMKTSTEDWIKKNPKKTALIGLASLILIGPKRIFKVAKIGLSSGILMSIIKK